MTKECSKALYLTIGCRSQGNETIQSDVVNEELKRFEELKDLKRKMEMLEDCDVRVDDENYDNLRYQAYFRGLLMQFILNHSRELKAKINALFLDLKGHINE